MRKRPRDRVRERVDEADRRVRRPEWAEAARAFDADRDARVRCRACAGGLLRADFVAFKAGAGGELIVQCDGCGAWHVAVRAVAPSGWRDD